MNWKIHWKISKEDKREDHWTWKEDLWCYEDLGTKKVKEFLKRWASPARQMRHQQADNTYIIEVLEGKDEDKESEKWFESNFSNLRKVIVIYIQELKTKTKQNKTKSK